MLKISSQRFEAGTNRFEVNGTRLEQEFLGEVNKRKYKELAYMFLHKELSKKADNPDDEFMRILSIRDKAQLEFQNALDLSSRGKFIDVDDSFKLVEKCQIGDPEKPSTFFASTLYKKVKEYYAEQGEYVLKYFTAVGGTHLDVCHGIDAFFKLYDKESGDELAMASLDLTMNPNKTEPGKADVLADIKAEDYSKYDTSKNNEEFDKEFCENRIGDISNMVIYAMEEDKKKTKKKF